MKAHVEVSGGEALQLSGGVLVYRGRSRTYCAWHEAVAADGGAVRLGPAKPLTGEFVRCLAGEMRIEPRIEVLPGSILVWTADLFAWWTPSATRTMYFRNTDEATSKLNGRKFPQPPLVWAANGRHLRIRALAENVRPMATTKLYVAPYFNTDGETAEVCQGSMRSPGECGTDAISLWEQAFFRSEFTHQTGIRKLTSHSGGFYGLWRGLAGKSRFPAKFLVPANETLLEFAQREH